MAEKRVSLAVIEDWEGGLLARVYVRVRGAPKLIAMRTGKGAYIEAELPALLRPAVHARSSRGRRR